MDNSLFIGHALMKPAPSQKLSYFSGLGTDFFASSSLPLRIQSEEARYLKKKLANFGNVGHCLKNISAKYEPNYSPKEGLIIFLRYH